MGIIYLDNAATSHPKPDEVYRMVGHVLRNVSANPGRSGHQMAIEADRTIFEARESVARLFGIVHTDRIIFTQNATGALNLALKGLLAPGDHCITTSMEHNSIVRPLKYLSDFGVRVTRVEASREGVLDAGDVLSAIRPETKLIAMTHASNVIGTLTPAAEIASEARKKGVPVLLDASQTAGSVPINVEEMGVDLLACPGHKGLLGPQGTGFLYVSPNVSLKPIMFGGTGSRSDLENMPDFMPDRYEAGTLNTPGIAGLGAGAEYLYREGLHNIRAHEVVLCGRLIEGLKRIEGLKVYGVAEPERRSSVVSFTVDGIDPAAIGNCLDAEHGIAVRIGIHCAPDAHRTIGTFPAGTVRMSPGCFNTPADMDAAVEAVKAIAAGRPNRAKGGVCAKAARG